MKIAINRLHYPVTALGPGRRIGIWLQGCSIGCSGCVSRDTWETRADRFGDVDDVLSWCRAIAEPVEGITISGGEPFEQPEALLHLVRGLAAWRDSGREIDVLCYSGMPWSRLRQRHAAILAHLDAVIPEPFVEGRPTEAAWRGSSNQSLVRLSPLGERRYPEEAAEQLPRMQVSVDNGQILADSGFPVAATSIESWKRATPAASSWELRHGERDQMPFLLSCA